MNSAKYKFICSIQTKRVKIILPKTNPSNKLLLI